MAVPLNKPSMVKNSWCLGIAKISLDSLDFTHPLVEEKHRTLTKSNITRLRRVFLQTGCERLQLENYVNAIVDHSALQTAVESAGLSLEDLSNSGEGDSIPQLQLTTVYCLSGLHRVEAAKEVLEGNERWWVVRLFSRDTPQELLIRIIESYVNEERPSDGDIFRKIRLYHSLGDEESEKRWWTYLSNSKPKDLRQLIKKRELISEFDALLDIPGLWSRIQLGTLHRLLTMRCEEEMVCYLKHVNNVWRRILKNPTNSIPPSSVDATTAENLQLLLPRADRSLISNMMQKKEIFPTVHDKELRNTLLENVCKIECLIPTLWTFFENLKYLEPCCEAIKHLLGDRFKGTIRSRLTACFSPPTKIYVQTNESFEAEYTKTIDADQKFHISYVELWAFCARHMDGLTNFSPRKENGREKPLFKPLNPLILQYLAKFATSRGFFTQNAKRLASQDSQTALAIDFLRKANPIVEDYTPDQIRAVVSAGSRSSVMACKPILPTDRTCLSVPRRCGRPFEDDYAVDKKRLFLPTIFTTAPAHNIEVTLGYIRRDLFESFFGTSTLNSADLSGEKEASWLQTFIDGERAEEPREDNKENNRLKNELSTALEALGRERQALKKMKEKFRRSGLKRLQHPVLSLSKRASLSARPAPSKRKRRKSSGYAESSGWVTVTIQTFNNVSKTDYEIVFLRRRDSEYQGKRKRIALDQSKIEAVLREIEQYEKEAGNMRIMCAETYRIVTNRSVSDITGACLSAGTLFVGSEEDLTAWALSNTILPYADHTSTRDVLDDYLYEDEEAG